MKTNEFLNDFISPSCHKVVHSIDEYDVVKEDAVQIKATTLYQIYKHNVYPSSDDRLTMKQFFHVCGQYLYYDKYVCDHGTEFYYYVKFNDENEMYKLTEPVIQKRITANAPDTLKDLKYIMKAVSKQ